MDMNRKAVKFYILEIVTEPSVDDWEASFDRGVTFYAGTLVDGNWQWLLAGPDASDADASPAITRIARSITPTVRATSAPEVLYEKAPRIALFR